MYKKSTEIALAFKFETEHLHIFLVWKNLTLKCGCWLNNKKESPLAGQEHECVSREHESPSTQEKSKTKKGELAQRIKNI